jgi:hypothetical protein
MRHSQWDVWSIAQENTVCSQRQSRQNPFSIQQGGRPSFELIETLRAGDRIGAMSGRDAVVDVLIQGVARGDLVFMIYAKRRRRVLKQRPQQSSPIWSGGGVRLLACFCDSVYQLDPGRGCLGMSGAADACRSSYRVVRHPNCDQKRTALTVHSVMWARRGLILRMPDPEKRLDPVTVSRIVTNS